MHSHNHETMEAKGLRRARLISATKGSFFFVLSLVSRNPGLALISGHDIGDSLALSDEVKASETSDPKERSRFVRKAGNKILGFTLGFGAAEIATEIFVPGHGHPGLALGASATTLALDIYARHAVKHDTHHSHHGIGHHHVDLDVTASATNLVGTACAFGLQNSAPVYLSTATIAYLAYRTKVKIEKQADAIAQEPCMDAHEHPENESHPHHE